MLSNDPYVPDYGKYEINVALSVEKDATTLYSAPIIDFNYGLIPNMQFTLESAYNWREAENDIDSLEIGIKYLWIDSESFALSSVTNYVSYPVNSIFDEGETYEFGISTNFVLSENLSLKFTPTFVYKAKNNYHLELGSYLQYNYKLQSFYTEVFGEESELRDRKFLLLNLGYMYQFDKNVAFMCSFGHEFLEKGSDTFISYSGLQITF